MVFVVLLTEMGEKNKTLTPVSGRNPDGTFIRGNLAAGTPPHYRYAARAAVLENELSAAEILALDGSDELLKRPYIDTVVIRRMARALKRIEPESCSDLERALEAHLDRTEGKTPLAVYDERAQQAPEITLREAARRIGFLLQYEAHKAEEEAKTIDHSQK